MTDHRRSLALALPVFVCCVLGSCASEPPGPTDAAGRYFEVERRLLTADHLVVDFDITSSGAVTTEITGQLRLATGNRLDLRAAGSFGGQDVQLVLRSDGTRLTGSNGTKTIDQGTPKDLNKAVVLGMTRMGLLHNLAVLSGGRPPDRAGGGVTDWISVDSHRAAADDTITFDLSVSGAKTATVTLTLRGDGLPVHRQQTVRFPGGTMTVRERYPTITIDGPMDAGRFTHP